MQEVELADGVIAYVEAVGAGDREEVGVMESLPFEQVSEPG